MHILVGVFGETGEVHILGCITPNKIPLTTIVAFRKILK